MPCREPDLDRECEDDAQKEKFYLENRIVHLTNKLNKYEPAFCAVMTVLENRDDITSVAIEATKQTGVDILPPWTNHKDRDLCRIRKDLSKYTSKEILMIAGIVNSKVITLDE